MSDEPVTRRPNASVLVIDAANVVGSRPDGWWKDRPGAARRLYEGVRNADLTEDRVELVLEGRSRAGVPADPDGRPQVVHASGSGDDEIVRRVAAAIQRGETVVVATSDRGLLARVTDLGADRLTPTRLWSMLDAQ